MWSNVGHLQTSVTPNLMAYMTEKSGHYLNGLIMHISINY